MSFEGTGITDFETARQALIFRYYYPQADYTSMISQPRDNSQFGQNLSVNQNTPVIPGDPNYISDMARYSQLFPLMDTKLDFARQYVLLLAQWNQQALFEKKKIRDFVNFIEARKGRAFVSAQTAYDNTANITLLSLDTNTTVLPWNYGNEPFIRELVDSYFTPEQTDRQ